MESVYQEGVRNAEQEARYVPLGGVVWRLVVDGGFWGGVVGDVDGSILSKAKEKLEILAALRQATEIYGDQKRKRKDAPSEIQPSKTKKVKMSLPFSVLPFPSPSRFIN